MPSQRQLREKLLEAARRREIDVVLVWRLDRWADPWRTCWKLYRN
jgi:DNA invertase Pin-like site-specific DNA recombinase